MSDSSDNVYVYGCTTIANSTNPNGWGLFRTVVSSSTGTFIRVWISGYCECVSIKIDETTIDTTYSLHFYPSSSTFFILTTQWGVNSATISVINDYSGVANVLTNGLILDMNTMYFVGQ
jgi:hypothetical protein